MKVNKKLFDFSTLYVKKQVIPKILYNKMPFIILGLGCLMSFFSPYFLSQSNLITILQQISIITIIAIGATLVIIGGGIDLSVGSVASLCGLITAGLIVNNGFTVIVSLFLGLLAGLVVGIINGIITVKARIPSFIVTLAMMQIARGIGYIYTGGFPISGFSESFRNLGRGYLGPFPIPVIIMISLVIIGEFILQRTILGRYIYAIGGNKEAAQLSGVPVVLIEIFTFALGGLLAGLGGLILIARLGSGEPTAGMGYEFNAITAVILGGCSLKGGIGNIIGTLQGALIIGILNNGMVLMGVNTFYQYVITGLVLLVAVILDRKRSNA